MINYTGKDKTIKNIHDNLNKIEWIMKNKRPIPENQNPLESENWFEDLMKNMGKGNNPFGGYQW